MNRFDIDESTYGRWTAEFQRLLDLANEVEFFRSNGEATEGVAEMAELLVELLAEPLVVHIESGDWQECEVLMRMVDPWADELGRAVEAQTERIMSDPSLAARIGPPLWPVAGMLNVVEVIVADKDQVLANVPSAFKDVGWRLGCAVEKLAWGALRWSISYDGKQNPYEVALRLAAKGVFTLGRRGVELVFFTFRSDR